MSKIRRREKSSPYLWAKETLTSEQEQKLINLKYVKPRSVFTQKQLQQLERVTRVDTPGPLINKG